MKEKLLAILPRGIGDAVQSIVGLRIALSKQQNIIAVVEPNLVRLLSKQFQSISFVSNKSRDFFDEKRHFTLLINNILTDQNLRFVLTFIWKIIN
jgi:hypothetical protein